MTKYILIPLLLIILISGFLRLVYLVDYPSGFNADEAALGYNAYSLLQTGRDEYGNLLPLNLKSFGDYKPALYAYITIPFVAAFGLNEFAVRLPSALFGVGTVILVFYLARLLFKNQTMGLISAALLAISPWHLHFSRGAWESNVATFFITLGVLLFLKSMNNILFILPSLTAFLASMYTYQSPRLTVPIFLLCLFLIYRSYFLKNRRHVMKILSVIVVLSIPLVVQLTSGTASSRFLGLSFFSDIGPINRLNELRGEHQDASSLDAKLAHNKLTAYIPLSLKHYLDHFSTNFLFINGDEISRNKTPEVGQFYLIESIGLVLGLAFLFLRPIKNYQILIVWVLTAPLASSLTYQTPNALRSHSLIIPMILIISYGFLNLISVINKKTVRFFIIGIMGLFLLFEATHYLESYYFHYPKRYPDSWEYGFKEMVQKVELHKNNYKKIIITDRYDQPYILTLFYAKYQPEKFQSQAILSPRDKYNFGTVRKYDNYEFRSFTQDEVDRASDTLFIGTPKDLTGQNIEIDKVKYPNGDDAFIMVGK